MKKIFTFMAAMLVAFAVNADLVVLPATLDVNNVSFRSEGMPDFVIEEGQDYAGTYFDMGAHDSSNDTLLYAEWDVTIEPLKYNLAVDVYNTNSWRVQLYLLNQAGDTLKSLRYKGSSEQKGNFAIGSMDMRDLAAGNYKLRARAATAWSAMKLKDIIVEADYQGANVALPGTLTPAYALLFGNASIANNAINFKPSTANTDYATWNVSFAAAGNYNVSIDLTASNGHNYGVALLSADGTTEIGAVNEGGQHGDTGVKALGAIAVPAAGNYVVKLTNATQWSEAVLNSITFAGETPVLPTVAIAGSMNSWNAETNVMTPAEDGLSASVTINLTDWYYEFKVVVDGSQWMSLGDNPEDLYTLHRNWNKVSGLATDKQNFKLTPDVVPGDYTFKWTYATGELEVIFPAEPVYPDVTLYFVNTPNWATVYAYAWDPEIAAWPGELATLTEMTIWDYAVYSYTMPENRKNIIFNDGTNGDGHQTANLAVEDGKPYFYKTQWYESLDAVATAISNTEAAMPVEKMIENGQLFIIKNGVKYNAQGTVVK